MDSVLNAALPIFALIFVGFWVSKRGILGTAATESLNNFVVWLALPALLFQATAQITADQLAHFSFMAAFGGGAIITFVLSFLLDRQPSSHRLADRTIEGLDAGYANTGFMGIPLCLVAFGPAGLPPAIISTIMTACVLFAGAIVMIELDLQSGTNLAKTLRKVGWSLARNPLLVSPVLGFAYAATGLALPAPVLRFTTLLGNAATPCALVTIGLFLAQSGSGLQRPGTVARLVALKLLAQPAITALLAFGVFHMPPLWANSAVLLGALPIGTGPFMLAKLYNREAGVTSSAILASTVLSVITISLLVAWFGQV
jgi:predicted permease